MKKMASLTLSMLLFPTLAAAQAYGAPVSATIPLPPTPAGMSAAPTPAVAPILAQNMDHLRRLDRDLRHSKAALQNQLRRNHDARWNRANRLAILVNNGKCGEAYNVAVSEADELMAQRIAEVCSED